MTYKFNELIKYDSTFTGENGDFSGTEDALGKDGRYKFLSEYSDFEMRINNLTASQKSVTQQQTDEVCKWINYDIQNKERDVIVFKEMDAALFDHPKIYKDWQFYTSKVRVKGGEIVFDDGNMTPIPCAKYEFTPGKLREFTFDIYIGADFKACAVKEQKYNVSDFIVKSGRIIELRSGTDEVLKLQFYENGTLMAMVGVPDIYHHKSVFLTGYEFDKWHSITIKADQNSYNVLFDGKQVGSNILLTSTKPADTLFISGGMHPGGKWKVLPVNLDCGRRTNCFFLLENKNSYVAERTQLGRVALPYGIGGIANKDKHLVLSAVFKGRAGKRAYLKLESLDPGGTVYINGKQVLSKDDFLSADIDISDVVCSGENLLEIIVNPRAPERNCFWHGCRDPYTAWVCRDVQVHFYSNSYVESLKVKTLSADCSGESADVEISVKVRQFSRAPDDNIKLSVYLSEPVCFDSELTEHQNAGTALLDEAQENVGLGRTEIATATIGDTHFVDNISVKEFTVKLKVRAWTPENPVLYTLSAQLSDMDGKLIDGLAVETGFRTIGQNGGDMLLNGNKIILKGALIMQYLPPYSSLCISHVNPTDEQIVMQLLALKNMNGNTARLHILGYGTNDSRYARLCDRLGIMLIWTTRLIDSIECVSRREHWQQTQAYRMQMRDVINHPSIIMWEGTNEFHAEREYTDRMYDNFVTEVKKEDTSRLICPCSHLYYGGNLYLKHGFYYQNDGLKDQDFNECKSSFGWKDPLVVRSSHNYEILLGYGETWDKFRRQQWESQHAMLTSKERAYIVSEFAVIGRHDHTVTEAEEYVKNDSYELTDEYKALGFSLTQDEWRISQAFQSLAARSTVKLLRSLDADGVLWCCLSGGANDGSYLKPPIDFYWYAKYAFYALREGFQQTVCFNARTDVVWGRGYTIEPVISGLRAGYCYDIEIVLKDKLGNKIDSKNYFIRYDGAFIKEMQKWTPVLEVDGYYHIEYTVMERKTND